MGGKLMRFHVYSFMLGGYLFMDLTREEAEARASERGRQGERCTIVQVG